MSLNWAIKLLNPGRFHFGARKILDLNGQLSTGNRQLAGMPDMRDTKHQIRRRSNVEDHVEGRRSERRGLGSARARPTGPRASRPLRMPAAQSTALAAGPYGELAVGTDNGIVLYKYGEWKIQTDSTGNLPSKEITALAFGQSDIIYAGTNAGLLKIDQGKVTVVLLGHRMEGIAKEYIAHGEAEDIHLIANLSQKHRDTACCIKP